MCVSKAFNTVDHQILQKKLEYYGIAGNNLRWLKSYLNDQKQFIPFEHNSIKTSPSEPLVLSLNILNVYQINIFQSVQFMQKIKNKNVPHIFLKLFGISCHAYPTNLS